MNFSGMRLGAVGLALFFTTACGGGVSSEESARRVYFGLDRAVDRGLNLGMAGFNAASSANIPMQVGMGEVSGTMTVTGQVDQGASANKGMRLQTALSNYSDRTNADDAGDRNSGLVFNTSGEAPSLNLSLRGIPDGTFTGSWTGRVTMSGDLSGDVTLNLQFAGRIEREPGSMNGLRRVAGSTAITGTVQSSYGTYTVNITR